MTAKRKRLTLLGLVLLIVVLYAATWIWGVPSAHRAVMYDLFGYWPQAKAGRDIDPSSYIRVSSAFAPLPLVVIIHYEYEAGPHQGMEGSNVYIWWVVGETPIFGDR